MELIRDLEASLPRELEFSGEFGTELALFTPYCYWLSRVGLLQNRYVKIYRGMRCFYDELVCAGLTEKDEFRAYVSPQKQPSWLPVKNPHNFDGNGRSPLHFYPDFRAKFAKLPLLPDIENKNGPILIIHNKYNNEWNSGPVNHISIASLNELFCALEKQFTLVYIRHGMGPKDPGFADDHNNPETFDDRALLADHPEVLCFDDLYALHKVKGGTQDINTFKNVLYSRCHRFISSQGGGALQIAMFSGSVLSILHRKGSEESWAYGDGYYGFMAAVPPIRVICRSESDLLNSVTVFVDSKVVGGRAFPNVKSYRVLDNLSPWTIASRP